MPHHLRLQGPIEPPHVQRAVAVAGPDLVSKADHVEGVRRVSPHLRAPGPVGVPRQHTPIRRRAPDAVLWERTAHSPHAAPQTPTAPRAAPPGDTPCEGSPSPQGMHWMGGRYPPPLQGAQPMPSHCLP